MELELLTPKEKAEQLVKSFAGWTTSVTASMTIRSAKACAKIHISELLKFAYENMLDGDIDHYITYSRREDSFIEYYKNVIEEIEKIK